MAGIPTAYDRGNICIISRLFFQAITNPCHAVKDSGKIIVRLNDTSFFLKTFVLTEY